jgi:hypothetical protein
MIHAPRGPFYSPKAARSRWRSTWKANLAFYRVVHRIVRGTTRHEQFQSGARSLSFSGEADHWIFRSIGTPDTIRCTPDSPVRLSDRWLGHVSPVDHVDDRWPRAPMVHRTVWCTTGQSGAPPDSPVNYSRDATSFSRERRVRRRSAWVRAQMTHRIVRCTTGQSGEF